MKRFLLLLLLSASFFIEAIGQGQVALNEVYVEPKSTTNEFFELYYSGGNSAGESVDCWTIVTYYTDGTKKGVYVMDLPSGTLNPPDRFFVGASSNPFTAQGSANKVPDFNWNDVNFRNGSTGGYLKKFEVNSSGAFADVSSTLPTQLLDFMPGGNGKDYVVLVFVNGVFENGFVGGSNSSFLSADIQNLPDLTVTLSGSCVSSSFLIDFSTLGAIEQVNSQAGSDNGFIRTSDGKCGSWAKSSSSSEHTPGITNGSATAATGSLTTSQVINCGASPRTVTVSVTGVSGNATEADDFPVGITIYDDNNRDGILDPGDVAITPTFYQANLSSPATTVNMPDPNADLLISYRTARGCFDKIFRLQTACSPLPVSLKAFYAARNKGIVALKWITASESNNKGFNIQRNTKGVWETIAFVFSAANGGNSSSDLFYSYNDANSEKGVSQYRIQQVDIDGKSKLSEIRSVRGEEMSSRMLVFPNPSNTGNVSLVFEDAAVKNVRVSDMSGRVVRQLKNVSNSASIEGLENGVYSIQVTDISSAAVVIEKVIIKKR